MRPPRDPAPPALSPRLRAALTTALAAAAALALMVTGLVTTTAPQAAAAPGQLCGEIDVQPVDGGAYSVQNNRFGIPGGQCVTARDGGFTVDQADGAIAPGGPPKSYPSLVAGCHWGRCTDAPGLPVRASDVGDARTAVSITRAPGSWNAAYDIWFASTPDPQGQNDGTELMIWIDGEDAPDPIGEVVGSVTIGGAVWDVWQGEIGWDVISFVRREGATSVDLALEPFVREAIERGATEPGWWMTSVQFGFEPWSGGEGLAADDFSWTPPSGAEPGGDTSGPTTGQEPAGPAPAPIAPPSTEPPPARASGGALVRQAGGDRCLDARGSGAAGDPQVALWECDDSQTWTLEPGGDLVHDDTGACLGPVSGEAGSAAPVELQVCDASEVQRWERDGDELVHTASGRCLTVGPTVVGAPANGTPITVGRCLGA